jgi:hypothetical protein
MGCSDSLPPVPPHFVAFAWRYHACDTMIRVPAFTPLPPAGVTPQADQGGFMPGAPSGSWAWRRQGLPGSWGTLLRTCSALRPRRDRSRQARYDTSDAAFRRHHVVGSRDHNHFGACHAACSLAVYASQPGLPADHARLASGCWPTLPGGTGYPLGSAVRFSSPSCTSSPRLCLAHGAVA